MYDQISSWGSDEHNQCLVKDGSLTSSIDRFKRKLTLNERVDSIACGSSHCLILADDGDVFSWGNNKMGQVCGQKKTVDHPQRIILNHRCPRTVDGCIESPRIRKISAGGSFSIFITDCGCIIKRGSIFGDINQSVDLPIESPMGNVEKVSCGICHVVLLLSSGHVACFGRNMYGQIGIQREDLDKNIDTVASPRIVTQHLLHRITKVAAGSYHSLCCDETNQLFCWGYGVPCGVAKGHIMQPSYLPGVGQPIKAMTAGSSHSLFLTESGDVYGLGGNDFSQAIPECELNFVGTLTIIQYFTEGIENIFCGDYYSVVIKESGEMCIWGKNSLVIDPKYSLSHIFKTPQTIISKKSLGNSKIVSISCGAWHILCHSIVSKDDSQFDIKMGTEIISLKEAADCFVDKNEYEADYCIYPNFSTDAPASVRCGLKEQGKSSLPTNSNVYASTFGRARAHTTLRELYSQTPNPLKACDNRTAIIPTRNVNGNKDVHSIPKETPPTESDNSLSNKHFDHIDKNHFRGFEKQRCDVVGDKSCPGKEFSYSKNRLNGFVKDDFLKDIVNSHKEVLRRSDHQQQSLSQDLNHSRAPMENTFCEIRSNFYDQIHPSYSPAISIKTVNVEHNNDFLPFYEPKQTFTNRDNTENKTQTQRFPRIPDKINHHKDSERKVERSPLNRFHTDFIASSKYFCINRTSVEQFQRSFKFPPKIDLMLDEEYTMQPHNFFSKRRLKTFHFGKE